MELPFLTWISLLFFYTLYVLLGECVFHNNPDHEEKHADQQDSNNQEAMEKFKLIMVDMMAKLLLNDDSNESSNFTHIFKKILKMNRSNCDSKNGNPIPQVFKLIQALNFFVLKLEHHFRSAYTEERLHCRQS